MRLERAAAAAAAAVAVVASAAAGSAPAGLTASKLLLPDLVQVSPAQLDGRTVKTPAGVRFRLGFASAVYNAGAGPLEVIGARRSRAAPNMTAAQIVRRADGSALRVPNVGTLRYVRSETHQHWHLLGFERYQLRRARDGKLVRGDRKTGFCLGDRYDAYPHGGLAGQPLAKVWKGLCERKRPEILTIREGISVGYGDNYKPQLEGQYIDVTRLPAGEYELLHSVNVDRALRESSYVNNSASIRIKISWPQGFDAGPRVDVVARCGDGRRCR